MAFMTFHVCKSPSFTDHQFLSKLFFLGLSKAYLRWFKRFSESITKYFEASNRICTWFYNFMAVMN